MSFSWPQYFAYALSTNEAAVVYKIGIKIVAMVVAIVPILI